MFFTPAFLVLLYHIGTVWMMLNMDKRKGRQHFIAAAGTTFYMGEKQQEIPTEVFIYLFS
ncbi:hypothetical protein CGZ90_10275 [Fictibacillus aquaticus]|uniref:Uncharacterized protein n=1 Tax=Fictibacillus aquaticus TaxID=2021314 RepID=A0A235FAD1_9BACL|nr:hypothetical protein CGZ90_10275 [Fictibacillus aquaticus]